MVKNAPWQGFHHLALQTPNLDATVQFYREVLDMQIMFTAPAGDIHGRHAGINIGTGSVGFLHFFENPSAEIVPPPDLMTMHWMPGAIHHVAFGLPDEAAALTLQAKLDALNIATSEVMDQGDTYNLLFLDNSGILLEANWPHV